MATQHGQAPLLSVTVLNYNYGRFLPTCLDSILAQSFKDFELILINDKSTDNSLEIIKPYLSDPRVRLVDHEVNKGFVASLIEGCELSRGKYITVVSADDWVLDTRALEKQVAVMEQEPELAFVYSAYGHFVDEKTYESAWRGAKASYVLPGREAFRELVVNPFLLHTGTVIRKTAYDAVGGYDASLKYLVDARMWLSLCHVGKVAYIDEVLYAYRRHGNNMSRNMAAHRFEIAEVLRIISASFDKHPLGHTPSFIRLRHKAEQRALVAYAIDDVFRNHYQSGWSSYWIAYQIRPFQTLTQKTTLILVLRTLLGGKGYRWLSNLQFRRSPRGGLAAAAK